MKKILFSLFAIFSLFFINSDVFASTADLAAENLHLSQEEWTEVSNFINDSVGERLGLLYCNQIWITATAYDSTDSHLIKKYYVHYYDTLKQAFGPNDSLTFWFEYYREIIVTKENDNYTLTYDFTRKSPGYGEFFPISKFDINNYMIPTWSYHFALSLEPISVRTNMDETDLIFFYHPGFNFETGIYMNELKENAQENYDDYFSDSEGNLENKNIFQRIWSSLVNGFESLINGIISLPEKIGQAFQNVFSFVFPDREYFETQIAVLDKLFNEELGFLYESFDFMFDIINRFLNIGNGSKVITIPTIREPISNHVIIEETTFNFDDVLNSSNIKILHTLYLAFVDVIVFIGLINLGRKQFDKVVGGHL